MDFLKKLLTDGKVKTALVALGGALVLYFMQYFGLVAPVVTP